MTAKDYPFEIKRIKCYDEEVDFLVEYKDFPHIIGVGSSIAQAIEEGQISLQIYLDNQQKSNKVVPEPVCDNFMGKMSAEQFFSFPEELGLLIQNCFEFEKFLSFAYDKYLDYQKHSEYLSNYYRLMGSKGFVITNRGRCLSLTEFNHSSYTFDNFKM